MARHSVGPGAIFLTFLIFAFAIVAVTLGIIVVSRPAVASPRVLPDIPPIGLFCSLEPGEMVCWNSECPASNATLCDTWRNTTNHTCIYETCTDVLMGPAFSLGNPNLAPPPPVDSIFFVTFNSVEPPAEGVTLARLLSHFLVDNTPSQLVPSVIPAPRPFAANGNFTSDNLNTSYVTAAYELARQVLAARWAIFWANDFITENVTQLVYTPQRSSCPTSAGLSNITWMTANTTGFVPVYSLILFANTMLGMNMEGAPATNQTLFLEVCADFTTVANYDFCGTVFQAPYYPFAILQNYEAATTLWRDLVNLLSVFTSTFSQCGLVEETKGCFGLLPPT